MEFFVKSQFMRVLYSLLHAVCQVNGMAIPKDEQKRHIQVYIESQFKYLKRTKLNTLPDIIKNEVD